MQRSFLVALGILAAAIPGSASVIYNNLTPNDTIGVATRPESAGFFEIEAADDFLLGVAASINSASFTGLIVPGAAGAGATIDQVIVEIYRVFPLDSTDPPSGHVTTRMNSPSDVAFASRDSGAGGLTFTSSAIASPFVALNTVQPGGIHPLPGEATGGNGPLTGQEVQINVNFLTPFSLPAGHYFFVPQVHLTNGGNFFWLSASRPISGAGTTPFLPDLQMWTRDAALDPDWLRVGADIENQGRTFNGAFSLDGTFAPEPSSWLLLAGGLALALGSRKFKSEPRP